MGTVFDIQHYAVHDGPGIRTLVFLKGCPLSCGWCCNPESQTFQPQLRYVAFRCQKCLRCVESCPRHAITHGDVGPIIERTSCQDCESWPCLEQCPGGALLRTGRSMTATDVIEEVAKDIDFYRNSGGGVTFSGGEPFAQPAFLLELLSLAKRRGISTAVETCGHAMPQHLQAAEPAVDHFLFDLKVMDPVRHAQLTGRDNELILANLELLASLAPHKITIRHAVIPGCNDDALNHEAIVNCMNRLGLRSLHLEPYHPLGEGKYAELGRRYACDADARSLKPERMQLLKTFFIERGLDCEFA
ncbi:MAG: glycyl-radical enzyme activating protein [Planctomycetaceae bacterium]|nr:glycyl-radical enzyme activating protein [Planctomycetaceae bacterium]